MRFTRLAVLGIALVLVIGCGGGKSSTGSVVPPAHGTWTVMVYMAADNDLEEYAIQNVNDMERVGSSSQVSVVAQIDRSSGYDTSNGDWSTTRRYYITHDSDTRIVNSTMISDLGKQDMADPRTLSDFIAWATTAYPADHYLLVLWDHGRGWRTRALTQTHRVVRSMFIDDSSGHEMSLNSMAGALRAGPKLDIVLFDACLMGMVEVADALKDSSDIMVASEDNVPAGGQDYTGLISTLTGNPDIAPAALATTVVNQYAAHYAGDYGGPITLSALDLHKIGQVVSASDQLASAVLAGLPASRSAVDGARAATQHFDFDNFWYIDYKDLYDFADRLDLGLPGSTQVHNAAQAVESAVTAAVISERHVGVDVPNAHGISVYLPGRAQIASDYSSLLFATDTSWDEMLRDY